MILKNARVMIDGADIEAKKLLIDKFSGIVIVYKNNKIMGSKRIVTHISKCVIEEQ